MNNQSSGGGSGSMLGLYLFLGGVIVGGVLGLLYAPRTGKEMRQLVAGKTVEYKDKAVDMAYQAKDTAIDMANRARTAVTDTAKKAQTKVEAAKNA